MKRIYIYFVFTIFCSAVCISVISCSEDKSTTPVVPKDRVTMWQEDIDYLNSQLRSKQLDLFSIIPEQKFQNTLNNIKANISSLQDYEIFIKLQQMIASMHVAHNTISSIGSGKFHYLPILASFFPDGLYIIQADNQNTNLLGKKIIKVGGKDIQVVLDSLKTIFSYENNYWFNAKGAQLLSFAEALKYFGFTNLLSEVEVEIENSGKVILKTIELSPGNFTSGFTSILNGKVIPLYMQNASSNYWYSFIEADSILFLKYNVCSNMPAKSFADLVKEIIEFIPSHNVSKFVVDLRNNGGGNSSVIEPLSFLQSSYLNKTGKLFVIIGRNTFSSALLNAISFKQNSNCLLIGEPTGGKPNSYGEVLYFTLPYSGLITTYTTKYFTKLIGDPEALKPDYQVDISFNDYLNCKDPVMEFIINFSPGK